MPNVFSKAAHLAAGFGLVTTVAQAQGSYRGYEAPSYEVVRQIGAAELRTYAPHVLAEVTVRGSQDRALREGFSILARYIFGGNDAGASISMTSPVAQQSNPEIEAAQNGEAAIWTIGFMMPSDFSLATLPAPQTDAIRFSQTEPSQKIVLQFAGRANATNLDEHLKELRQIAQAEGITIDDAPAFYFYDDPMTLPWNRRNEIAFTVLP